LGAVEDDFRPNTGLNLLRRDDGGYLAIIKRDDNLESQVMMAYGEDVFDALLALNRKVAKGSWRKDTPYKAPKNSE